MRIEAKIGFWAKSTILICVLFGSCSTSRRDSESTVPASLSVTQADLTVDGIHIGDSGNTVRSLFPDRFKGHRNSIRDAVISSADQATGPITILFEDGKVASVYGSSLEFKGHRFTRLQPASHLKVLLGSPDSVLQVDRSPDRLSSWSYDHLRLSVGIDASGKLEGGFYLESEQVRRPLGGSSWGKPLVPSGTP